MLQPTPTLTDQVAGQLARAIADGAYAVGAKLPTGRALAQQYGVSAAVIREATERLRAQGLVQSRQGSGCTVVARTPAGGFQVPAGGLDRAHLARVYELRMELEGGAAALAARRRGAADLDRMRQALQALQREPIEPEQGVVHDVGFHVAIATATANPITCSCCNTSTCNCARRWRPRAPIRGARATLCTRCTKNTWRSTAPSNAASPRRRAAAQHHLLGAAARLQLDMNL